MVLAFNRSCLQQVENYDLPLHHSSPWCKVCTMSPTFSDWPDRVPGPDRVFILMSGNYEMRWNDRNTRANILGVQVWSQQKHETSRHRTFAQKWHFCAHTCQKSPSKSKVVICGQPCAQKCILAHTAPSGRSRTQTSPCPSNDAMIWIFMWQYVESGHIHIYIYMLAPPPKTYLFVWTHAVEIAGLQT